MAFSLFVYLFVYSFYMFYFEQFRHIWIQKKYTGIIHIRSGEYNVILK